MSREKNEISKLFLEWRKYFRMPVREFAKKINKSVSFVHYTEVGRSIPYDRTIREIAESLGITFDTFMDGPQIYEKKKWKLTIRKDLDQYLQQMAKTLQVTQELVLEAAIFDMYNADVDEQKRRIKAVF